jgi:hypothetical protein
LAARALQGPRASPATDAEHRRALDLREALRDLMLANNGRPVEGDAAAELERAATRGELGVHFDAAGGVSLLPGTAGVDGALAQLLGRVV